ncbi:lytic transglycosylase domain-containing protein [Campylobacter sp. RM10532]|uniref:Lytic transglycosylase domain-containing protein n=1 Tax=Campylobacter molothri TaxID=1032242 RepID=A0ACC5W0T1_9BACT|nr:lytic transglycosylase domain-containing protein [Campylobacter sp. RM12910]MBZ7937104.1 lytic transglycosylase domain-containing protein [Campylobacter sp. RM10538]MBZ7943114.1 lytic transglycosylase domain-containing protein [Campylobacter sp. RM13744]MBZ7944501.1 lytic transglycosylase domain-containing protein [Campylobacter sp. RM10532]MBZ7946219.1 lytic transglycosylase domain-containing protein [Campylobacter sp. RM10536]MBZ7951883.1 lytic transglycosylase domain-containing protein [
MKKICLLFLSFIYLNALEYDLKTLKKQDNSLAKDYYIYRLLEKKTLGKEEIENLKSHIFRYTGKIKTEFEKIIPIKPYINPKYIQCYTYTNNTILDANLSCQSVRLNSISFIESLSNKDRDILAKKFDSKRPDFSNLLLAFNSNKPMKYMEEKDDVNGFYKLYKYLKTDDGDFDINASFVNKISNYNDFDNFAQTIIIQKQYPKFRYSLLQTNPKNTKEYTAFYLGINALTYNKDHIAYEFFKQAAQTFKSRSGRDNAIFWMWLIKKDEKDLQMLAQSNSLNIYSLYAKELTHTAFPKIETINVNKKKNDFNMQDPFAWQKLNKTILEANATQLDVLAKKFDTEETLPIYAYILERKSKFKKHYFITPYYQYIKDYDIPRQALILAIARQESRFIPTAISVSYALGLMQFMPFLANHIGEKELKIPNFDQDFMFKPEIAFYFGNHHLDYLEKRLKSPLFIAYAYNGGIGFVTRLLAKDDMFKNGKYEPFLSMELVPYQESRIYGKKVLANYIVYRHLLNDSIKISDIFENLIQNKANDLNKS